MKQKPFTVKQLLKCTIGFNVENDVECRFPFTLRIVCRRASIQKFKINLDCTRKNIHLLKEARNVNLQKDV